MTFPSHVSDVRSSIPETPELDRVDQPQQDNGPARVPASVQHKMKLLESWKSSKLWRVAKNVGAGLVGAGIALALASNPVGWGVTAAVLGVGGVMALAGTVATVRADFAKLDVEAFKQSLESGGQLQGTAPGWKKARAFGLNVLESAAFGVTGFFAGAGIGAAFLPAKFKALAAVKQGMGNELATQIALPAIYGVGTIAESIPGFFFDRSRNQPNPELRYQVNISEGLEEYQGDLNQGIPKSALSHKYYREGKKIADRHPQERTPVTVSGPLVRHFAETEAPHIHGHQPVGATHLPNRNPPDSIRVDDRTLLEALSKQEREAKYTKHVKSSGYAVKTIPTGQPLFQSGPPKLEDLRQSHNRGNCPVVAAIAGALVRDGGWRKIEQIMADNGDGTVTVRLADADVVVDKTRLVTDQGYSSFDTGSDWAHLLEKAIAAYALTRETGQLKAADYAKYSDSFRYLNHLMGPPDQNAADVDNSADPDLVNDMRASNYPPEWPRIIRHSLANGHPVCFATQDADYGGKLKKRLLPRHNYPVIGLADRNGKRGYLVFDPHSISAGPFPNRQSSNNSLTYDHAQHGNSPVFFVAEDEAADLFDDHRLLCTRAAANAPPEPSEELVQV